MTLPAEDHPSTPGTAARIRIDRLASERVEVRGTVKGLPQGGTVGLRWTGDAGFQVWRRDGEYLVRGTT